MQKWLMRWPGWGMGRGGVVLLLLVGVWTAAPAGQESVPRSINRNPHSVFDTATDPDPALTQRRLRALNEARQKMMVSDTEKLLRLAQELSAETQAGAAEPTAEQGAKVAEIEKLAHRIKQKMMEPGPAEPFFVPSPMSIER